MIQDMRRSCEPASLWSRRQYAPTAMEIDDQRILLDPKPSLD